VLRDKARQSDMLADDEALLSFFDRRVPAEVVNGKTFEDWREGAEARDPQLLLLSFQDVLGSDRTLAPELYPDQIRVLGVELAASYRFEPGADERRRFAAHSAAALAAAHERRARRHHSRVARAKTRGAAR
jgi:ATP-dependent helicase HrpA